MAPFVAAVAAQTEPRNPLAWPAGRRLDTFEGRFVSNSTQVGQRLFNVHTTSMDGTNTAPTGRFYEFNLATSPGSVARWGLLYATATSDDFNASMAADNSRFAFLNWNSTDTSPSRCLAPEIRFAGLNGTEAPQGDQFAGAMLFGSTFSKQQGSPATDPRADLRWGDYSAISIDPSPTSPLTPCSHRAWLVNEVTRTTDTWTSRFGAIALC